jgi:hypothetical protein
LHSSSDVRSRVGNNTNVDANVLNVSNIGNATSAANVSNNNNLAANILNVSDNGNVNNAANVSNDNKVTNNTNVSTNSVGILPIFPCYQCERL